MKASEQQAIFERWVHQHKGVLFKVVHAYARTVQDRDDLFQEISLQLWESIPRYEGRSSEATWMYRIALYVAMAWNKRERRRFELDRDIQTQHPMLKMTPDPPDERLDWLYQQIAALNAVDRSLALLLLDGFSYKEMAEILGISVSNVGVKINRLKKQLVERSRTIDHHGI